MRMGCGVKHDHKRIDCASIWPLTFPANCLACVQACAHAVGWVSYRSRFACVRACVRACVSAWVGGWVGGCASLGVSGQTALEEVAG